MSCPGDAAAIVLGVALSIVSTILAMALIRLYCGKCRNLLYSSREVEEVAGENRVQNSSSYFSTSNGGREQHSTTKEVNHNVLYTRTNKAKTPPQHSSVECIPEAAYPENRTLPTSPQVVAGGDISTMLQASHLASQQISPNQHYSDISDFDAANESAGPSSLHNEKWKLPTSNQRPTQPARTTYLANTISPSHSSVADSSGNSNRGAVNTISQDESVYSVVDDARGNTNRDAANTISPEESVYSMAGEFPGGVQALYSSIQKESR